MKFFGKYFRVTHCRSQDSEVRYTSLRKSFPKDADELFKAAEESAKSRYNVYKRYSLMDYTK